ncbi:MAG: Integral membrane sensor signal transduction histidine kinase [Candidatus Magasanikbacteria bacterium GW2011_GWA2_37_8]|uniref:histidine kinase n=1 Tax=Candidatus Magasanikbacteria bacterium GW2011_GWA2_37_8 TaxID=1619036 RepID=A0A0G0HCD7_9BACT|nr:MAG: Integral membrane sensor signal transduction histidine kinase [Candidatus Magasanikbacteria bacterium GW2011_GWA2_37_8]
MFFNCLDSFPTFLGLFDPSIAPILLYYSYIPIILVSLFFGFYVYFKSKQSLLAKYLFAIAISFSLFILNEIIQWIAVPIALVNFGWAMAPLFQALVWIFTIYFFYYFLEKKSMPWRGQILLLIAFLPIIIFLPSRFNIVYFDIQNCEAGQIGPLWYYLYALQIISTIWLLVWGIVKYRHTAVRKVKDQIILLAVGVSFFLFTFSLSNILGEIFQTYEINLVGPIGMVLFIGLLAYLIIEYKIFNIKLFAAQALLVGMVVLVGSQFFFIKTVANQILTAITLVLVTVFGWRLARSVKKEIASKERFERLTVELKTANLQLKEVDQQKTEFLSIASHQLRTPLSILKGYIELIQDGAYGKTTKAMYETLGQMDESNERLIKLVDEFLDITRIEQGRTKFVFASHNLNDLLTSVVKELTDRAGDKSISISLKILEGKNSELIMDDEKIRHVVFNFIDNAIKYSETGVIKVAARLDGNGVEVTVKDSGLGFDKEDEANFFQKFYRGKNVKGTNVTGTGLGLYVCRKFIETHGGKVWAHSFGLGKGSEFGFWIPVQQLVDDKGKA